MRFGQVVVTGGFGASVDIDQADVWVYPYTSIERSYATCLDIADPECRIGLRFDDFQASRIAIAHEFAHLALGLGDEYPEDIDGTNAGDRRVGPCIDTTEAGAALTAKVCLMQAVRSIDGELSIQFDAEDQLDLSVTGELCVDHVHDLVAGDDQDCSETEVDGCERPAGSPSAMNPCSANCCLFNFDSCRYEGTHHSRTTLAAGAGVQSCWAGLADRFSFIVPPGAGQLPDETDDPQCSESVEFDCTDIQGANQVMLVLDRSWSMSYSAAEGQSGGINCESICAMPGATDCCQSSLDFLQQSATLFLTLDQSNPDAEAGIVAFSSAASLRAGLQPVAANLDALETVIDQITANGQTNIGAGLELAHEELLDAAPGTKAVLLITDGVQSVDESDGGVDPIDAAEALAADGIRVFTISTGEASSIDGLGNIAEQTGGDALDSPDARELISAFALQWANHTNADILIPKLRYRVYAPTVATTPEPPGEIRRASSWSSGDDAPPNFPVVNNRVAFDVEASATSVTLVVAGTMDNMAGFGPRVVLSGPAGDQPSSFDTLGLVSGPDVTIVRQRFFHMIRLHHPNPGPWTAEVSVPVAPDVAVIQEGTLTILVENPSTRFLTSVDRHVVNPGDPSVRVGAEAVHVTHLLELEELEATVIRPDGSTQSIALSPTGPDLPVYDGLVVDFPFQGKYEVRVRARTGPGTRNHPGEPVFSLDGPNTVAVPLLERTRSECFWVTSGQKVCTGPRNDCDGDGLPDTVDSLRDDKDGDGIPNGCDLDSDNDEVPDSEESREDPDSDGLPDWCDTDSDGDGIPDGDDPTPTGGAGIYELDLPLVAVPVDCNATREGHVRLVSSGPLQSADLRFIWRPIEQVRIVAVNPGPDVPERALSSFSARFEEPAGSTGAVRVQMSFRPGSELPAGQGIALLSFSIAAEPGAPVGSFAPLLGGARGEMAMMVGSNELLVLVTPVVTIGRVDIVGDTTPPTIFCPPHIPVLLGPDCCADFRGQATAVDDCDANPSVQPISLRLCGSTPRPVVWTATDAAGNVGHCSSLLIPVDRTPPTIISPESVAVECDSPRGTIVEFSVRADDNCGARGVSLVCDPPSGSVFATGTTTVQCRALDASGNAASSSFDVTVTCSAPPCPVEDVVCSVVDGIATITWSLGGEGVSCGCARIEIRHSPSGTVLDSVSPEVTGFRIDCDRLPSPSGQLIAACVTEDESELRGFCSYDCRAVGGGGQRPFDCNQDGTVDIADPICVLSHLFLGTPRTLPCGNGTTADPANVQLFDWNGDGAIDIADGIGGLSHLFLGGFGHALGPISQCVPIDGCRAICDR